MTDATTITVPAGDLRERLLAVLPHASDDDTLPALNGVTIDIRGGVLYLAASDRYQLAVARLAVPAHEDEPVPDCKAVLELPDARALAAMLDETERPLTAVMKITDGLVAVSCAGRRSRWPAETGGLVVPWRSTIRDALAAPVSELGAGFAIDMNRLAKFEACYSDGRLNAGARMRVTLGGRELGDREGRAPLLVLTWGDWFIGLIQPMRSPDECAWDAWSAATAARHPEPAGAGS